MRYKIGFGDTMKVSQSGKLYIHVFICIGDQFSKLIAVTNKSNYFGLFNGT